MMNNSNSNNSKYIVTVITGQWSEDIPVFARSLEEAHDKAELEYSTFSIKRVRPAVSLQTKDKEVTQL